MNKHVRLLAAVLAVLVLTVGVVACTTGELGITNFDSLTLRDDLIVGDDLTVTDDAAVSGDLTVTGDLNATVSLDGASGSDVTLDGLTVTGAISNTDGLEHIRFPSYATTSITWTAAAGVTETLFTIGADEVWYVNYIAVEIIDDFDATGDDATMNIGPTSDTDLLCSMSDEYLQLAGIDFGVTGWTCLDGGAGNAKFDSGVIVPGPDTIVGVVGETSGTTLSAGEALVHLFYYRIR